MLLLVKANLLAVGTGNITGLLEKLPIVITEQESGILAVRSLKNSQIDGVISKWDLPDMPDGLFLRNLRIARPNIGTIALIEESNQEQEISARMIGVNAVITESVSYEYLNAIIAQILKIEKFAAIEV